MLGYKVRCYGYRMCQFRGMLVVQGTLLYYGYGVQCGRYGVRCCRCMPRAQGMPCRVLGTFEVGRSQWRIGTLFFTVSFIVINMPTSLSQGYSGNRRICNHKFNLCSHKRGLQSQFPTLQNLSSCDGCVDSIRNCVSHG